MSMNWYGKWRRGGAWGLIVVSGVGLLCLGGCPVDWDALTTDVTEAALSSVSASLVDALSAYLAGA
jgi:hypothetical protein